MMTELVSFSKCLYGRKNTKFAIEGQNFFISSSLAIITFQKESPSKDIKFSLEACLFFGRNLPNFVSPSLKLNNQYCHTVHFSAFWKTKI